jgi:myo-inositol 2-dehydrogenase / D-chiro-inositol 1-dehydrogenase
MAPLRAGIIGAGWIARVHAPAVDAAADVELVAACDITLEHAEAIARPRGAHAYASWEEMLDREELDALWVCTPPLHHRGPTLAALASGIHVYLEKPIARTLDDAEAIVSAARSADAVCAVGYQWHASELVDEARQALDGQRVAMLVGRNYGPVAARPWFMDRARGGGQILERGSHHIDLQRVIAGDISAVQAVAASERLAQAETEASIDDAIMLLFHFESGALGSVHSAWSQDGQPEMYATDIIATEATISLELGPDVYRISGLSGSRTLGAKFRDPMNRSIARFLEAARTGDAGLVFCSPGDALRTLAVALACERALEDGGRIDVWS